MNIKPLSPIVQAQVNQMRQAKRLPLGERHHKGIISYNHMTKPKYKLDIYSQPAEKVPILAFKRYDKKTLRLIYREYLSHWTMSLRACLLNGVFFSSYNQAYRALRTMVEMGLLVKHGHDFVLKN